MCVLFPAQTRVALVVQWTILDTQVSDKLAVLVCEAHLIVVNLQPRFELFAYR